MCIKINAFTQPAMMFYYVNVGTRILLHAENGNFIFLYTVSNNVKFTTDH